MVVLRFRSGSNRIGLTALDSSGRDNHGNLLGGPVWVVNGVLDGALSFDGADDHVDLGISDFSLVSELSISLWVYVKGNGPDFYQTLIKRGAYVYPFSIRLAGRRIQSIIRTGAGANYLISDLSLQFGRWYHIAVTYRDGERILYFNGNPHKGDAPQGNLSTVGDQPTFLGGRFSSLGSAHNANVILDDVRLYNTALSGAQIQALYNEGGMPPKLVTIGISPQTDSEDLPRMIKSLRNEGEDIAIQLFDLSNVWRK